MFAGVCVCAEKWEFSLSYFADLINVPQSIFFSGAVLTLQIIEPSNYRAATDILVLKISFSFYLVSIQSFKF